MNKKLVIKYLNNLGHNVTKLGILIYSPDKTKIQFMFYKDNKNNHSDNIFFLTEDTEQYLNWEKLYFRKKKILKIKENGSSRESYKITTRWKYGGKTFFKKVKSIYFLFEHLIKYKNNRQLFIIDNFTQPFNKLIGCKLFGHDFQYDGEDSEYFCKKCWKRVDEDKYHQLIRKEKILKIIRKI